MKDSVCQNNKTHEVLTSWCADGQMLRPAGVQMFCRKSKPAHWLSFTSWLFVNYFLKSAWNTDSGGNWTNRKKNWLQIKSQNILLTFCIKPIFILIPLVPISTFCVRTFKTVKRKSKPWKHPECQTFEAIKSRRWRSCTEAVSDNCSIDLFYI